ncbi:MAG: formylglycine-generating enzyme family protein [Bacteroidota bacterium]
MKKSKQSCLLITVILVIITGPQIQAQPVSIHKPEMILVQGGRFLMGCLTSTPGEVDDLQKSFEDRAKPAFYATVDSFYISKYEITVQQFADFVNATAYITEAEQKGSSVAILSSSSNYKKTNNINWRFNVSGTQKLPEKDYTLPAIYISWNDANAYCEWLSSITHEKYRLPTEAEWEYAAKGGNKSKGYRYSGSDSINKVGWCGNNSGFFLHPIGQKAPNELGIYDMTGNVQEWCLDRYGAYLPKEQYNPSGPTDGTQKVIRGSSWFFLKNCHDVVYRSPVEPDYSSAQIGFRIVKEVKN